jgi:sugar-specific transcriptional regulator TrmB
MSHIISENVSKKKHRQLGDLRLSREQRLYLDRIGLSRDALRLYELLLQKGKLSAQQAAVYTGDFPSAHYRLFYSLQKHHLARSLTGRPKMFEALPLAQGLRLSFYNHEREMRVLLDTALGAPQQHDVTASVILGRQAVYDEYVRLVKTAQQEVRLYSIGIAFSDKLEKTQRSLIKRGVRIRHVIQQRKLSNQHVVAKWQRIGVKLRYLKQPRGFHFFIVDNHTVCVTFSNLSDTDNRISLLTANKAAVQLFEAQFQIIWDQSTSIDD